MNLQSQKPESLGKLAAEIAERMAACGSEEEVERIRIDYLGRKDGRLTLLLRSLKDVPATDRPGRGAELNHIRTDLEQRLETTIKSLRESAKNDLLRVEREQPSDSRSARAAR